MKSLCIAAAVPAYTAAIMAAFIAAMTAHLGM
jgi:hypothetical protein